MAHSIPCAYCARRFTAHRPNAAYCSDSCRVRASRDRKYACWYCGHRGDARDHVTPHCLSGHAVKAWAGVDTVECCAECNSLLGTYPSKTVAERCAYLSTRLQRKYRLDRPHVEWDADEIAELRDGLRAYVRGSEARFWEAWRRWQHVLGRMMQTLPLEPQEDCADPAAARVRRAAQDRLMAGADLPEMEN